MRHFIAAVIVGSIVMLSGAPGTAVASTAVTAAHEVTVSGTGGSFLTLDVPRDTVVDFGVTEDAFYDYVVAGQWRTTGFRTIDLQASGPWSGVVLAAEGPPPPPGKICAGVPDPQCPPIAAALQFEDTVLTKNRWVSFNLGFERADAIPGRLVVPEGRYRLYLVGDTSTHRATVRFEGLQGAASAIASQRAAGYENRLLEPRLDGGSGQRAVQSFGSSFTSKQQNLTVIGLAVAGGSIQPFAGTEWGFCGYFGTHPDPDETAYLPGCPSGWLIEEGEGWALDFSGADRVTKQTMLAAASAHGAGKDAAGWWYASYGAAERSEAPLLQLDVGIP